MTLLLEKFKDYDINAVAKIDGYNPLLASAEVDAVGCIKLLKKYGANMNFITSEDNQIIQGGNAISVAAYCAIVCRREKLYLDTPI